MHSQQRDRPLRTLVIGIGNAWRGDDAAGLLVAHALAARKIPHVTVVEAGSVGPELMDLWRDADRVILVDAVVSGGEPGAIHRFDVHSQPIPEDLVSCSTHSFGLAGVIDLARALDCLPPQLVVYGIEACSFEHGEAISSSVLHGLATCADAIVHEIRQLMVRDGMVEAVRAALGEDAFASISAESTQG